MAPRDVSKILARHHWCWEQQPAKIKWMWMLNILPYFLEQGESWEVQETIWLLTANLICLWWRSLYISVGMGVKTVVLLVLVGRVLFLVSVVHCFLYCSFFHLIEVAFLYFLSETIALLTTLKIVILFPWFQVFLSNTEIWFWMSFSTLIVSSFR